MALEWIAVFILQYFCQLMQSGGDEAGAIAPGFGAEGLVSFAMSIATIVSGGQSGVDRGALEAAVAKRVEYRGWCPLGGWAEDTPIPQGIRAQFPHLTETPEQDPRQRTEWNIRDSDAVLALFDDRVASNFSVVPADKRQPSRQTANKRRLRSRPQQQCDLQAPSPEPSRALCVPVPAQGAVAAPAEPQDWDLLRNREWFRAWLVRDLHAVSPRPLSDVEVTMSRYVARRACISFRISSGYHRPLAGDPRCRGASLPLQRRQ